MRLEWAQPGGLARPLPAYRLFREWPDTEDVRLAYGVAWLQRTVAPFWIAILLAWLGTLAWQRVGPHSPYGRHWERAFRVAIEGPFGLSASEETGSSLEESDSATSGTDGHLLPGRKSSRTRITIAVLLGTAVRGPRGSLSPGARSPFNRRLTSDPLNYIDVARNLSAGEGLVQSAAATISARSGVRTSRRTSRTRRAPATTPATPCLIAAVAEATGLEHADAGIRLSAP